MTIDAFAAWQLTQIADCLARGLAPRREAVEAEAALLAPLGSGPGFRVSIYRESSSYPAQERTFGAAYPDWDDFWTALIGRDAAAIEVGLELLSRVEPNAAWPAARLAVALVPQAWKCLWPIAARALARIDHPDAFAELLAIARQPFCSNQIGASAYRDGGPLALTTLEANPVFRRESSDPIDRLIATGLLLYLGRQRFEAAWPLLVGVWREHPIMDLRIPAGHVLLQWGDARSLDVLLEVRDDVGRWRHIFRVRAAVQRDPKTVIEQLGGFEVLTAAASENLVAQLLDVVARDAASKQPEGLAEADPRFLDLGLALVGTKSLKRVAKWLIDAYPPEAVARARKRIPAAPKAPRRARVDEAIVESMRRSRANLERIVEVLSTTGYQFLNPGRVLFDPDPAALKKLAAVVGPLPRSLEAAYQEIGGCDLRGSHPDWACNACLELPGANEPVWMTDPFVLMPATMVLQDALEQDADGWSLPIAPDSFGKAGYSGGAYTMLVPDGRRDAPIEGASHGGSVIECFSHVFAWGGFPGFEHIPDPPTDFLRRLRDVVTEL